ncbi:GNAT family N-acetyltransferase [Marinilabilia rubra]|uniref:N-acetyltransferase n=1 Tax=Marinilabilia rubra TaxID=2162893 RepID=A0A2U2BB66_9BACT|nr:GNAT family N-acetyltransferase [Marinilabilia rubra]PWE00301.1 N-acetyltransferase [Marinilabilia rubra]
MELPEISINKDKKRFELQVDHHTAKLYYEAYEPSVWRLTSTQVPGDLKGQGVGSSLVKQTVQYCRNNHIRVIPECPFIVKYMDRHPEMKDVLFEQG